MKVLAFALVAGLSTWTSVAVAQEQTQLGAYQLYYPYPSPDAARIVFQGNFDGRWQLYEMTAATGAIRRLHTSSGDDTHPAWSPDGARIAFISDRDGNDEVYVLTLATGEVEIIAPHPGKDGHPRWSADGQQLVFNRTFDPEDRDGDRDSAIVSVRLQNGRTTTLSDTPNIETMASFSPDALSIAMVEWLPSASGSPVGDIVVVDPRGRRRNLTNSPEFDGWPFWGRSGEWIYFSTIVDDGAGPREARLRRVRVSDGTIQELARRDGVGEVRAIPDALEQTLYFNQAAPGLQRVDIFQAPIQPIG